MNKILLVLLFIGFGFAQKTDNMLSKAIYSYADELSQSIPIGSTIFITDHADFSGVTSYFGKYVAVKISNKLAMNENFTIVDRNSIDLVLKEQELQYSGVANEQTAVELGTMIGANIIIFGTITEFLKEVNIDSKIISVKTSKVIGTADFSIKKSADVANLIATVILSSSQQKEELEKERQKILQDIESERADKLAGLQFEEKQLKQKIVDLEREYREKSVVLKEYKVQQEKLNDIDDEIAKIYRSIDRASNKISSLKIGMTPKDIKKIIGKRFNKSTYERHAIVGKYILVFEEGVLVKGCKLGEEVDIGYSTVIVDGGVQCSINGTNIIKY